MSAQTGRKRPPSQRIADDLRHAITSGEIAAGDKLPSERVLAAKYGTARNTARQAIDLLRAEGLAVARHGAGVFVRVKPPLMRLGSNRYSRALRQETGVSPFRSEVMKQGRVPHTNNTSIERVKPPIEVAERLGVSATTKSVVRRETWYYADDEAVQVGITYVPWDIAKGSVIAMRAYLGKGSLYARFEELGHTLSRIREEISARMPTPDEAQDLEIPNGVPVMEVLHTGFDQDGKAFEITQFILRADYNALDYHMPVED